MRAHEGAEHFHHNHQTIENKLFRKQWHTHRDEGPDPNFSERLSSRFTKKRDKIVGGVGVKQICQEVVAKILR